MGERADGDAAEVVAVEHRRSSLIWRRELVYETAVPPSTLWTANRLAVAAPVTAQLVNLSDHVCWQDTFAASAVQKSDDQLFKGRSPN
jgi:hypothetical protein